MPEHTFLLAQMTYVLQGLVNCTSLCAEDISSPAKGFVLHPSSCCYQRRMMDIDNDAMKCSQLAAPFLAVIPTHSQEGNPSLSLTHLPSSKSPHFSRF